MIAQQGRRIGEKRDEKRSERDQETKERKKAEGNKVCTGLRVSSIRAGRHVGATEVFYACQMRVLVSDLTLNSLHDPRSSAIHSLSSRTPTPNRTGSALFWRSPGLRKRFKENYRVALRSCNGERHDSGREARSIE